MSANVPAKRAAIYCRISRDDKQDGLGVARQEEACRQLVARYGWDVAEVFIDNDRGASELTHKSKVRTEYLRMIEGMKAGAFEFIVAYSQSRLTRRFDEAEERVRLSQETGVGIVTVTSGEEDVSAVDGRMQSRFTTLMDVTEVERIGERARAAHRQKAMKGKVKRQQQRPFGWKDDHVTIDPIEAAIIRKGVSDLARGLSIETIRQGWMEQGLRTSSGGTDWSWTTTNRVLLGWRAAGVRTYLKEPVRDVDGGLVMGKWDAIISLEERDAALAQTSKRRLVKRRHGVYLLSGLARCGECGGTMYGSVGQPSRPTVYTCKPGGGHVVISAERFENYVVTEMLTRIVNRVRADGPEVVEPEIRVWPKEQRLAQVGKNIRELLDAHNAGQLSGEVAFSRVEMLEVEQRELRREREVFTAVETPVEPLTFNTTKDLTEFVGKYQEKPLAERQAALKAEVRYVVVNKGQRGSQAKGWNAMTNRVNIIWNTPGR